MAATIKPRRPSTYIARFRLQVLARLQRELVVRGETAEALRLRSIYEETFDHG